MEKNTNPVSSSWNANMQVPLPNKISKKVKWGIVIFITIFLIVVSSVGFMFILNYLKNIRPVPNDVPTQVPPVPSVTPTPAQIVNTTADWKSFVNMDFGVEFKYPSHWDTLTKENFIYIGNPSLIEKYKNIIAGRGDYDPSMTSYIEVISFSGEWPPATLSRLDAEDVSFWDETLEDFTYGNVSGLKLTRTAKDYGDAKSPYFPGYKEVKYYVKKDSKNYIVIVDDNLNEPFTMEQFLATFQLTNNSGTQDVSDWKNYTSDSYGFSFNYPNTSVLSSSSNEYESVVYMGDYQKSTGRTQTELFDGYKFSVAIQDINEKTLEEYAGEIYDQDKSSTYNQGCAFSDLSNVTYGGVSSLTFSATCEGQNSRTYIALSNDSLYVINGFAVGSDPILDGYKNEINGILSTFIFETP
ncbi:hypothetical protein COV24_01280 [candidate division WWE3 bacterium CG10_big_fil_rev_8_21_14_0_10_32_10]|uniref:Uncharacterized protein n=1 Tax=candidate division WWE3 bacterium CG10_big_fil_rev_8_21_14_0_10_32_10 TaxID=1975090 RepID=A0A2H0RAW8_UNCKA|nr:MAG: hypothetical protein COV24_01280 [candidate division WWE3 bacterium CG10_big_fil_rev_8_21_14_0_10_32_10]